MKSISLCMIVKNEEDMLQQCLSSVADLMDEIIIIDTGSTDKTKEIARRFTEHIYDFTWCDDFAAARNEAFSKATMDYIMWLDADDVVLPENKEKLGLLKESLNESIDGVMMKYNMGIEPGFSYYRQRLVKRSIQARWHEPVHEWLDIIGNIITSDITINHVKQHPATDRNLMIYEKIISEGRALNCREAYYFARELYSRARYEEAVKYFQQVLVAKEGWKEDKINACWLLATCYENLKKEDEVLKVLLRSFEYDQPRAEICCSLGAYYIRHQLYQCAIYWYKQALNEKRDQANWGFRIEDYNSYVPYMQLCMCYDRIGNYKEAIRNNELAATYKPDSEAVQYNREYFKSIS